MKTFTFLFLALVLQTASAQDTTNVVFTQEQDTLVKQRFIDRYENVFMTKIPTKHMFKFGITFSPNYLFAIEYSEIESISLHLGYEYKVAPSFSLGTELTAAGSWGSESKFSGTLAGDIYGRWYYDMKRRIREGVSVSNFTGNYLAVLAGNRWGYSDNDYRMSRIGIEWGLQRRFFNHGRIEFAVGLAYQSYQRGYYPVLLVEGSNKKSELAISSRTSMGLAFGDWKRSRNAALCDVLHCDALLNQQWKLLWPQVYISSQFANATFGLAYERKLKGAPMSLNTQIEVNYLRIVSDFGTAGAKLVSNDYQLHPSMQLRYYLDQKEKIRRGIGGNNLSGIYIGPYADYVYYKSSTIFGEGRPKRHLGAGAGFGAQQALFNRAYIDVYANLSYNLLKTSPGAKPLLLSSKIAFGLTF